MENNQKNIQILQEIAGGLSAGALQHFSHANINIQRGFNKLGNRMLEEYREEMETVGKIINRILELGGTPNFIIEQFETYTDVETQLNKELKEQKEGLKTIERIIEENDWDKVTEDFLTQYLIEENEHLAWLQQQVNLIQSVGIQNYLTKQI